MRVKRLLVEALVVFAATLVVTMIMTLLWTIIVHNNASIDWETSFRFAIVLGIILPWVRTGKGMGKLPCHVKHHGKFSDGSIHYVHEISGIGWTALSRSFNLGLFSKN